MLSQLDNRKARWQSIWRAMLVSPMKVAIGGWVLLGGVLWALIRTATLYALPTMMPYEVAIGCIDDDETCRHGQAYSFTPLCPALLERFIGELVSLANIELEKDRDFIIELAKLRGHVLAQTRLPWFEANKPITLDRPSSDPRIVYRTDFKKEGIGTRIEVYAMPTSEGDGAATIECTKALKQAVSAQQEHNMMWLKLDNLAKEYPTLCPKDAEGMPVDNRN